jgi:hypothetical protein
MQDHFKNSSLSAIKTKGFEFQKCVLIITYFRFRCRHLCLSTRTEDRYREVPFCRESHVNIFFPATERAGSFASALPCDYNVTISGWAAECLAYNEETKIRLTSHTIIVKFNVHPQNFDM